MGREASALLQSFVYEYFGAWGCKRGFIEVKVSKYACMSRQFWLASGVLEVVKCDVTLWEKVVSFTEWKVRITG